MENIFEKVEDEGIKNTLKYFDRIHDKLFTFNNILIGGYFALSKIVASISIYTHTVVCGAQTTLLPLPKALKPLPI